jgi:hypothetical protein
MFSNIIDYEILSQSGMKFEKKKVSNLIQKINVYSIEN